MQRIIEQLADDGDVLDGDVQVGRVHYHLSVYQHFAETASDSVPANLEVEGRIVPSGPMAIDAYHRRAAELTLRLTDGRALDFCLVDATGRIRSTGRGLHQD